MICKMFIAEYNLKKERKVLIILDDMIADMADNKKLSPKVTEFFIRGRKLNLIFLLFLSHNRILKYQKMLD